MSSELKDPDFHARLILIIKDEQPFTWAARVGISKGAFHRIWNEGTVPGPDHLKRISQTTGVSIDWLLTGEGPLLREVASSAEQVALCDGEYVRVPRYEVAASAGGGAFIESEQIVDYLTFRAEWVRNALGVALNQLALINVIGDSMEPSLSEGDVVLLDLSQSGVRDSSIYVIQLDGALLVKRIQRKLDGSLTVSSDNPRYTPENVAGEAMALLKIIGRVVWVGRRL